ncbi:MAG TPA: hypothetical protein VFU11_04040 [Solirubrobacterales bacterium]|nr:hypothetical protein [Solirubrobacterales bacterium]
MASDWQKGGLRYTRLRENLFKQLAPEELKGFFIARRGRTRASGLFNPFLMLRREYVVVVTAKKLLILVLKRPGIFRASVATVEADASLEAVASRWCGGHLVVDGRPYWPISFHREDAEEVATLLRHSREA